MFDLTLLPALVFTVSASLFSGADAPFLQHTGPGFDSYLAQNLPYAPVPAFVSDVEREFGLTLRTRGEAHVTVITPPEAIRLGSHLSIQRIHELASPEVQRAALVPICLGRGQKALGGRLESTFFVVLNSSDLLDLRRRIAFEFQTAGGAPEAFDAESFHPHITLGFTLRDLHLQDGVIKDERSCVAALAVN
ncbi:MAG: 2'-5' RNA ligase family protein [Bdellovibrionales bacterium]|nr:2'-5' RNA ligase family protein [Bdellovibrionales bacterium]